MFPLALFLGVATLKNNPLIAFYCWPLVAFGGFFATLQSLMQIVPAWQHSPLCGGHCTLPTIAPFLSAGAFFLIAMLLFLPERIRH
jgi:hypothetical protein